ncbi:hypothetical protein ACIRST_41845 [Kitasatospora sp. NPDC101447]|uniref:hypothetical protein n=1 Tax=Kitasatospora sp. NPDC101447 TaxID=3364102 RepID=UPI00382C1CDC
MAGAVVGVGALLAIAAPQAMAAPASGVGPAAASEATVQLPAGAVPERWTIDRKAPAPKLPAAGAGQVSDPQGAQEAATGDWWLQPRNGKYQGQTCGTSRVDIVTGWGPMTLSLTQSRAISSQWSSSVSVDAWKVSGTVGFSVTDTATNTETGSYTVPEGKFGTLEAYPLFDHFTFDVYDTRVADHYVGGGDAYHSVGYCYNQLGEFSTCGDRVGSRARYSFSQPASRPHAPVGAPRPRAETGHGR